MKVITAVFSLIFLTIVLVGFVATCPAVSGGHVMAECMGMNMTTHLSDDGLMALHHISMYQSFSSTPFAPFVFAFLTLLLVAGFVAAYAIVAEKILRLKLRVAIERTSRTSYAPTVSQLFFIAWISLFSLSPTFA